MPTRRALLGTLAAGAATAVAGCAALTEPEPTPLPDATPGAADWPMWGYDARNTRYNAGASPPRAAPGVRWSTPLRSGHVPLVRGTRVVLNAGEHTVGVRATDGEIVWRSSAEPWGYEPPALGAERAFATGVDCANGFDLASGERTWRGRPCHGANTAGGTLVDGRLLLPYGGYLSALDATGRITWATPVDAQGGPAVADGTAYVATAFQAMALDLDASARTWPWAATDEDVPPHVDRAAATRWSAPSQVLATRRVQISPAVAGALVLATEERPGRPGGTLRALARDDGAERWLASSVPGRRSGDGPDPVGRPTAPVVADDLIVAALGDRRLRAFRPDGSVEWTADRPRAVDALAAGGDTLLALTHDRTAPGPRPGHAALTAVDLADGEPRWSRRFPDHLRGLAVAGGTVYTTVVTERDGDGDVVGQRLLALG